jgi:hypothetical protein
MLHCPSTNPVWSSEPPASSFAPVTKRSRVHSSTTSLTPTTSVGSHQSLSSKKSCIHGSVRTRTRQKPYWRHSCSRRRTSFVDLALLAWCMLFEIFSAFSCRWDIRGDRIGRALSIRLLGSVWTSHNPCFARSILL